MRSFPFRPIKFISSKSEVEVGGDRLQSVLISKREVQHVECRVPAGRYITGHDALDKLEVFENRVPFWEEDGG